ncbi:MAG TPA: restriction endonuclease [Patescibacteria group bacterium]|nr:restriction endonuclease [Patescibacteria group bacterium]
MEEVIGILFLIVLAIFWAISSASSSLNASKNNKEKALKAKEKWSDRLIDKSKTLEERNEDIIQSHLKKLNHGYHRSYYIENSVRDCIRDIAEAEGDINMSPNYEWLSNWQRRANSEYLQLKDNLLKRFRDYHQKLEEQQREKAQAKIETKFDLFKEKYSDLISQFLEVTYRKVSVIDDYGDEHWDVLPKEIETVIRKIAQKERYDEDQFKRWSKYDWSMPEELKKLSAYLEQRFKREYKTKKSRPITQVDFSPMSGTEFETYLARLLKENGFTDIAGTPATGDQGADLIAKRNGKTIIIQAKRYDGTVGNKAVQEVASAVQFYGADEGWVITNSMFTKSAKELAHKANVRLIDGTDLKQFSFYLESKAKV